MSCLIGWRIEATAVPETVTRLHRFLAIFLSIVSLTSFCSGLYADPPHASVAQHNDALAPALSGIRAPMGGERPRSNPLRHFTIQVHAVYPSVDQSVCSTFPPRVLWGWSYDVQSEYDWSGSLSGCGSNRSRMRFNGAGGGFRLHSELSGRSLVFDNPANPVPVGFSEADLAASSGPLRVWLDGRLYLDYAREVQLVQCRSFCYWNGCSTQSWVETFNDHASYVYDSSSAVYSYSIVVPASQMVLPTPWIGNISAFLPYLQAYAFTNTSWYRMDARWDGIQTGRQRYFEFDVRADERGAQSVWTVASVLAQSDPIFPALFSATASKTYRFAYRVDQSLAKTTKPGLHVWSLTGVDGFGNVANWTHRLFSHAASQLSLDFSSPFLSPLQPLDVFIRLTDQTGQPLAGKTVLLESSNAFLNVTTDIDGKARVRLFPAAGAYRVVARFLAQDGFASSFADRVVYVSTPSDDFSTHPVRFDGLLLGLTLVLALSLVRFR